jgi:hypothetical protein
MWEACEFLVKDLSQRDGRRIKGGTSPVPRIAYAVSEQTGLPRRELHRVVNKLYAVRKDIVHNAVEDPLNFEQMLVLLDEITKQILRYALGMEGMPPINLSRYFANDSAKE